MDVCYIIGTLCSFKIIAFSCCYRVDNLIDRKLFAHGPISDRANHKLRAHTLLCVSNHYFVVKFIFSNLP